MQRKVREEFIDANGIVWTQKAKKYQPKGVWKEQKREGKYTKTWWDKASKFKIAFIEDKDLEHYLTKCNDKQERVCLILLYYTGARPSEILELRLENIWYDKDVEGIGVSLVTKKGGDARTIFLPIDKFTQEILDYRNADHRGDLRVIRKWSNYWNIRDFVYKITDKKLTVYFFRHNRFSKMAKAGVSGHVLKYYKGARSIASLEKYIKLGGNEVKDILDKIK